MPARLRLTLFIIGLFAVTAAAGVLLFAVGESTTSAARFEGAMRPPKIPPAQFGLRDAYGNIVRLQQLRGKPTVVTFLYTTCEDTCPLTTQQIRQALDQLGHDVPVIAVSVDPANDTPDRAKAFTNEQHMTNRMRWVLGDASELRRLWRAFGIQAQTDELDHSASTVLLDANGRQRVGFATDVLTPEALAHDIALLEREAEGEPAP